MNLNHSWLCIALLAMSASGVGADVRHRPPPDTGPSGPRTEIFQQQTPLGSEQDEEETDEEPDCE